MGAGEEIYLASLKLAQPVQSYQAGAEIAAAHQRILMAQDAQNFDQSYKTLQQQATARQNDSQAALAREKLAEQARESDARDGLTSTHYADEKSHWQAMEAAKIPQQLPTDPNDPFQNSASVDSSQPTAQASPASAAEADWLQRDANNPAPAGTTTDDGSSYAPGSGPSPAFSNGPLTPGGQSMPPTSEVAPSQASLAASRSSIPMGGQLPTQRPEPYQPLGGGLLPPPTESTSPSPEAKGAPSLLPMGTPHPTIPGAKMGGDGMWWMPGSNAKFNDLPGPEGSNTTQRTWYSKDPKTGQTKQTHVETMKVTPKQGDQPAPWVEDDQKKKWVDGVQVEPTQIRTTENGKKIYTLNVVGDHPLEIDPKDPTKGTLKGAAGIRTPVTIDGVSVDKNGKVNYHLKTAQGDSALQAATPVEQAKAVKELSQAYKELGMDTSGFRFDKKGVPIPISIKETPPPKGGKTNNSIGALRRDFSEDDKGTIDTLLSKIKSTDYTPEEKAKFLPENADKKDPKAWQDAWYATQRSYATRLSNMLNERHNGKPGFKPVSVDELVKWGGRAPAGSAAVPSPAELSQPPPQQANPAASPYADLTPGLPPGGFSDQQQRDLGLRVPDAPAATPVKASWLSKLGL